MLIEDTPPPMKRRRLKNLGDYRKLLADVLNRIESDDIEHGKARLLIYGSQVAKSIIEAEDLEDIRQRLAALEEAKE